MKRTKMMISSCVTPCLVLPKDKSSVCRSSPRKSQDGRCDLQLVRSARSADISDLKLPRLNLGRTTGAVGFRGNVLDKQANTRSSI